MREVTSAKPFASSTPDISARSHWGSAHVSLLRNATNRPRASRTPALLPPANPRFSESATTLTDGNRDRTNSTVSSLDALSTRTISLDTSRWAATLGRQVSRCCRPFHVTMTTEMSGCTSGLPVHIEGGARRALPAERRRARQAARPQVIAKRVVVDHADDGIPPGGRVPWVEQQPGAPEHLRNRGLVGCKHG